MSITRRALIKASGAAAALGLIGTPTFASGAGKKVVIVGGGIGGATVAKYLRRADAGTEVTLIEPNNPYHTCFKSNEVVSGERRLQELRFDYSGLIGYGVRVIHDQVIAIESDKRQITTEGGLTLPYDRCVISPGIDFKWTGIAGHNADTAEQFPHAWKAGPQTTLLRQQLEAMTDGGTVIIAVPPPPYRCPPAPYERASLIAYYLQQHKPRSKVLILDHQAEFPAMAQFLQGWKHLYGYGSERSLIEWRGQNGVIRLDPASRTVTTTASEQHRGEVLNLIPAQQAGAIAVSAGLTDASGWCPVDLATFESTLATGIHVIGDACNADDMPKTGYAANSQAKVCAAAVVALLNGEKPAIPSYLHALYSRLGPNYTLSTAQVYRLSADRTRIQAVAGGTTPLDASIEQLKREAAYADSWYNNITRDVFM